VITVLGADVLGANQIRVSGTCVPSTADSCWCPHYAVGLDKSHEFYVIQFHNGPVIDTVRVEGQGVGILMFRGPWRGCGRVMIYPDNEL